MLTIKAFERAKAFGEAHGVKFTVFDGDGFGMYRALRDLDEVIDFSISNCLSLQWDRKELFVAGNSLLDRATQGSLPHELAHLLATLKRPSLCNDNDFLAWEFLLAKQLRVLPQWRYFMRDYELGNFEEFELRTFDDLTPQEWKRVLNLAMERGKKEGNLDEQGQLVFVR